MARVSAGTAVVGPKSGDTQPRTTEAPRDATVATSGAVPSAEEEGGGSWPDDAAESAFLAEARERGEVAAPAKPKEESAEETDAKPLPALNDLVQRIPADVRETLEDLFRARFVTVKRVPKRALKS